MVSHPHQVNWVVLTGMGVAVAFVVAVFAGLLWLNRRRRQQRGEHPPQRSKLLRPPGHTLAVKLSEMEEKLGFVFGQCVAAGAISGACCAGIFPLAWALATGQASLAQVVSIPRSYLLLSVMLAGFGGVLGLTQRFVVAMRLVETIRNHRLGLRGEQAIAEILSSPELVSAGYRAFHDFPGGKDWNVDHVVVGPSGVFVIETKTRVKRAAPDGGEDYKAVFDGLSIRFPWCEDSKAPVQARRNAESVAKFLLDSTALRVRVQPVVALPGWYVVLKANSDVKVLSGRQLPKFILASDRVLDDAQIQRLAFQIEQKCRDIEF